MRIPPTLLIGYGWPFLDRILHVGIVELRAARVDVGTALDRRLIRSSARMRNLRRQPHNMCQRGQKGAQEGKGQGGHSEGSREVPVV